MAKQILAAQKIGKYTLPEEIRQTLLSPSEKRVRRRALLIEKQRKAFIERHGDPFGITAKSQNH